MKLALYTITLVVFTAFSVWLIADQGYFGFITLAMREPWGLQVLLDLGIALFLLSPTIVRDARENGIPAWPFLVAMVFLGSIGALEYFAFREAKKLWKGSPDRSRATLPA